MRNCPGQSEAVLSSVGVILEHFPGRGLFCVYAYTVYCAVRGKSEEEIKPNLILIRVSCVWHCETGISSGPKLQLVFSDHHNG